MRSDANTLLTLENLSVRIGRQVILKDVSLNVQRGECIAVVGGSGAGKSTLLRSLLGLTRPGKPVAGRLDFDGRSVDFANSRNVPKPESIGYVPQNPDHGFDPFKRLMWQWLQAGRVITGRSEFTQSHEQLLHELGLRPFERSFPHQWSRGMQQRLLLAMALMGEPRLLILDEPTSALDPLIAAQVLRAVMSYAKEHGTAVLIVTHDLALAARYATRAAIMNSGRVIEFGDTSSLLTSPQTEYGRQLVNHRSWDLSGSAPSPSSIAAE